MGGGEKTAGTEDIKMRQTIRKKPRCTISAGTGFSLKPGKGGSETQSIYYDQSETKLCPTHPTGGSKNVILCILANMRYVRDGICTGYIKRWIHVSVPGDKKKVTT